MKRIIVLIVFAACIWTTVYGQKTQRGAFSLGFDSRATAANRIYQDDLYYQVYLGLSPEYFLMDQLTIGLQGGVEVVSLYPNYKANTYIAGLYSKYYFKTPSIFVKGGYTVSNQVGHDVIMALGYLFFPQNRLMIEPYVEYGIETKDKAMGNYLSSGIALRVYFN